MATSCNTCKKTAPEVSLKHCAKCSTTYYCSRECQKADWKVHKKICSQQAGSSQGTSSSSSSGLTDEEAAAQRSPPKGLDQPITKPFTHLDNKTWLHHRPEKDVYRLLIDGYRLRVDDDAKFGGDVAKDSIYSGQEHSLPDFLRFLAKVESAKNKALLPSWWTPEKKQACIALGMDKSQWQSLYARAEKSDIIEHYGDPRFSMQLRMFVETVLGSAPGGTGWDGNEDHDGADGEWWDGRDEDDHDVYLSSVVAILFEKRWAGMYLVQRAICRESVQAEIQATYRPIYRQRQGLHHAIHLHPFPLPSAHRTPTQHTVAPMRSAPSQYAMLSYAPVPCFESPSSWPPTGLPNMVPKPLTKRMKALTAAYCRIPKTSAISAGKRA
jgi:splicing suppressor protein 51